MQNPRPWVAIGVAITGAVLLLAGCAKAVDGAAVAGTTITADTSSSDQPAPTTDQTTESDTTSVTEDLTTSEVPTPPIDPTMETMETTEVGTASAGVGTQSADPLSAPPFQGATAADPGAFPGLVTSVGFQSPSGNIACGFFDDSVACQISDYTFEIPPRPTDCGDTGWGFNFAVDKVGGFMFCAGDVEGGGPSLAYGQQLGVGDYDCVSREDGITCVNVTNGSGFTLSREAYQLF